MMPHELVPNVSRARFRGVWLVSWVSATAFWLAPLSVRGAPVADAGVAAAPAHAQVAPSAAAAAVPPALPAPPTPPASNVPATDAETALERARAAYEYGEMDMVVDSARLVADGQLRATPPQRAQALRYLGIALFLTERRDGAETAFFDLLRLRPRARLDTTTTRPDVVAFFDGVRRRHAAEINQAASDRPGKSLALAFLPPAGQFQSGHLARGITIATLEAVSLGGALGTYLQLRAWRQPGNTFAPPQGGTGPDHTETARTLKALNYVAIAVFATTLVVGMVDGVASYFAVEPEDAVSTIADVFGRGYRF